ncbi:MAG TPA: hypothetical protein VHR47_04560 [Bacillota bacterium]|nr:hypothetical protein [Bacillota bacterium]
MDEKKIIVYACNKYNIDLGKDEILLCNGYNFCDDETRERRKCQKVELKPEHEK